MEYTVEITKSAFKSIVTNPQSSQRDRGAEVNSGELTEITQYYAEGCMLIKIHNFTANVTQYYIQDINA